MQSSIVVLLPRKNILAYMLNFTWKELYHLV